MATGQVWVYSSMNHRERLKHKVENKNPHEMAASSAFSFQKQKFPIIYLTIQGEHNKSIEHPFPTSNISSIKSQVLTCMDPDPTQNHFRSMNLDPNPDPNFSWAKRVPYSIFSGHILQGIRLMSTPCHPTKYDQEN